MTLTAAQVFRDYETDGDSSSGAHKVIKSDVRSWGLGVDAANAMIGSGYAGTISITPPTGLTPGLEITQVLSGSSLPTGNAANLIFIAGDTAQAAGAFINGFEISHVIGGSAMTGGRQSMAAFLGLTSATNAANPNRNYVSLYGNFYATSSDGGTDTGAGAKGAGFGLATWSDLQSGAVNFLDVGPEFDISIRTGASAKNKHCLSLITHALDAVSGASLDTLLSLGGQAGTIGMNAGITFDTHGGAAPLKTGGTAILVHDAMTMACFIDASLATISGDAIKTPGFRLTGAGAVLSSAATAGIGYSTGAGGTVAQATNKATGVALSTVTGAITMNAAALAAGAIVSFVLTNTAIAATDVLVLNHISGGTPGAYTLNAQAAAGTATINVRNNTAGSLSEAIVIEFAVIKGVTS